MLQTIGPPESAVTVQPMNLSMKRIPVKENGKQVGSYLFVQGDNGLVIEGYVFKAYKSGEIQIDKLRYDKEE